MKFYIAGVVLMAFQCLFLYLAYRWGQRDELKRTMRMLDHYARHHVKDHSGIDAVRILKELAKGKGFR